MKPNEQFSGRGQARHLCKECSKLGATKLAYQQTTRRMIDRFTGGVKRKQRERFARLLRHPNERIRRYAEFIVRAQHASTAWDDRADTAPPDELPSPAILTPAEADPLDNGLDVVAEESWHDESWRDGLAHDPAMFDDEIA